MHNMSTLVESMHIKRNNRQTDRCTLNNWRWHRVIRFSRRRHCWKYLRSSSDLQWLWLYRCHRRRVSGVWGGLSPPKPLILSPPKYFWPFRIDPTGFWTVWLSIYDALNHMTDDFKSNWESNKWANDDMLGIWVCLTVTWTDWMHWQVKKNDVGEVFVNFHAFYFNDMS